ncbi:MULTISPECIES: HAMP domain-containing sensor histidine kinase [unclassified Mesobacillus]|uniref:sensor histidine kinase n=1 Tax=unclassified Mesobacillus TaxID=2675270 RepID=UPI00203F3096|nr:MULTISPECIES: HAMP domain-containing sensor histidine kinase [unclassified Mesobacillus]MCM3123647.1 HAMP domain-containing histidine kinase [Mesobacillus sp. MER 33]MCM3234338.1 HAMP domain-containing histidine kinase [Mesobacillus sp. MER 48]
MDIKSKSKYLFVTWVLLIAFGLSGIFSVLTNGSRFMQGDYFESEEYNSQMDQFVSMLNMFELYKMPKEEMKKQITVSDEEIEEHRTRYGNLSDQISNISMQYEDQIRAAIDSENKAAEAVLKKERDEKIADITENFNSDEYVRAKIVKEKEKKIDEFYRDLENYRREFNNLGNAFKYYLKDNTTGEVITNLNLSKGESASDYLNKKNMYYVLDYEGLQKNYMFTGYNENFLPFNEVAETILENQKDRDMIGQIGLSKHASEKNIAIMNYKDYQKSQKLFFGYLLASIAALIASYFLAKRKPATVLGSFDKWKPFYGRIPLDVRAVILLTTAFFLLLAMTLISEQFVYYHSNVFATLTELFVSLVAAASLLAFGWIQLRFLSEYRKDWPKLKEDLNNSLLVKSYHSILNAFLIKSIGFQLLLILGLVFVMGMLFVAVLVAGGGEIIVIAFAFGVISLPIFIMIMRKAGYLNKVMKHTEELAAGNLGADIPVKGKSAIAKHAANINALRNTVKSSHKEQAKSERLKTELITNVSHDLRTPLTSIITYTELLKTPELAHEDRDSYIEILDRKSKRLKVLIDDLFEATKMASGNIELNKEKVDLNQLLQQALAEHNEALSQSSLKLRVSQPDHPVYAFVDGQKLWRVFDNLIGNILKYALENTRVYISVKEEQNQVVLTFKNITKYELGEDLDELFERFKRGDKSRHTEGSGLGLAIAKSIVDLHEGSLDIEVDGDLFKVTVVLDQLA